jgi:hypothetical protein
MKKMFTDFNNQEITMQNAVNDFISTKKGRKAEDTIRYYRERLPRYSLYLYTIFGGGVK